MKKSKVNKAVITAIGAVCWGTLLIALAAGVVRFFDSVKGFDFCNDVFSRGWEKNIEYSMLSRDLKSIISEDEFNDDTPEGRLEMYKKMNWVILDDRPANDFDGSTRQSKTPYFELAEIDGERTWIEIDVDVNCLFGRISVRNFTCKF